MIAQPQLTQRHTPAAYLEFETQAATRHEYINGDIVPMTGGTPNHNQILLNLAGALNFALRRQPYRVFAADQRLWIPVPKIYTYPDVMVIAGELAYQPGRRDTVMNPSVIIEVLSKSTREYDRGDKFAAYRTLPSFQEYLLVDQYACHVESYVKAGEKRWIFQEYDRMEATVTLESCDFAIALQDIYDKVEFDTPAPAAAEDTSDR
ncbi:Uma2 family endonuclease [Halomicronema sp. CCY15110]|uniref:Uma2 family endonuclease n=1 Tax=Halomicronema sp. CCY15110 TaxID=2767773 RepID=UPI00194F601B|nr:Uma2 family endonuclease [Halomicronema sp. CCY15110]